MKQKEQPNNKTQIRQQLIQIRDSIDAQRRRSAACRLYDKVLNWQGLTGQVLSYASFRSELDTNELNQELARQGRLVLPRLDRDEVSPWRVTLHQVHTPYNDLISNHLGILEPNPQTCPQISVEEIGLALIPGLGFDLQRQRIGYGKGTYDRLLVNAPGVETVGIGYREQLLVQALPVESHDVSLSSLLLL